MTYTANELISGAYYASGVVSREFETVSGSQVSDGLRWLNDILAEKAVDIDMIPYESVYTFNAQPGVESYYIPGLSAIDTIVFYKDNVRYSMRYEKRNEYFGTSRVESINSLPHEWYFERTFGGGKLYIYYQPDIVYPFEIHGIFRLQDVTKGQDLSLNSTTLNLGASTVYGDGTLTTGQLVINGVDMVGSYATIGELVNYINTGIVSNVKAEIVVNDFKLISETTNTCPASIKVEGSGSSPVITDRGIAAAATTSALTATYANGALGVGATLTNAGAMAAFTLDGVALALNDRVLIKNQANAFENGIYTVTTVGSGSINWVLTRALNYDQVAEMQAGNLVNVTGGTVNANTYWQQTNAIATVGTDSITFTAYNNISFANFSTQGNALISVKRPEGIDQFYITYLRYALADRICAEYNFDTPRNVSEQLDKYQRLIDKNSRPLDLRLKKVSILQKGRALNWGQVNIGKGYTTP